MNIGTNGFAEYSYLELIEKWVFLKAKKNIPATSWIILRILQR